MQRKMLAPKLMRDLDQPHKLWQKYFFALFLNIMLWLVMSLWQTASAAVPLITQSFNPPNIAANGVSQWIVTIRNPNPTPITTTSNFVQNLNAAGISLIPNVDISGSCPGKTKLANGFSVANNTVLPVGDCTIILAVTGITPGLYTQTIATASLKTNQGDNPVTNPAGLRILSALTLEKSFDDFLINSADTTMMRFKITNPNPVAVTLNAPAMVDIFPTNPGSMAVANSTATSTCTGTNITNGVGNALRAGDTDVRLSGGSLAANASCEIAIPITAITPGNYVNITSNLGSSAGNTQSASAGLFVVGDFVGLACDTLYATGGGPTFTEIGVINSNSVTASILGTQLFMSFASARDPQTGLLYYIEALTSNPRLAYFDLADNTNHLVAQTNIPTNTIVRAGFRKDGRLFTMDANTGELYSLNKTTGQIIHNYGYVQSVVIPGSGDLAFDIDDYMWLFAGGNTYRSTQPVGDGGSVVVDLIGVTPFSTLNALAYGSNARFFGQEQGNFYDVNTATGQVNFLGNLGAAFTDLASCAYPRVPVPAPIITKKFTPTNITPNGTSRLEIKLQNIAQYFLINVSFQDIFPVTPGAMTISSNNIVNQCGGNLTNLAGAPLQFGANGLKLTGALLPPNGECVISVDVTASALGTYTNTIPVGALTSNNAASNNVAATAQLTVKEVVLNPPSVTKNFVPAVIAPNGLSILTITLNNPNPQEIILASDLVDTFPAGIVLANTNFGGTCTGAVAGTVGGNTVRYQTESPIPANTNCTITAAVTGANVGDYVNTIPAGGLQTNAGNNADPASATLSIMNPVQLLRGKVFNDNGLGAGSIANNGILETNETGIGGVTVQLTDCNNVIYDTTTSTAGTGDYALQLPLNLAAGAPLCVIETNLNGYLSTGAQVGNTGGTYTRATDRVSFVFAPNTIYQNINFGDVPVNQWLQDNVRAVVAGTVSFYAHQFIAGSAGTVTFSTAGVATPNDPAWTSLLYEDVNCDGEIQANEPILTSKTVTAGQTVCVLDRVTSPNNAQVGDQYLVTVTANFVYVNANPALSAPPQTRTDLTQIAPATGLTLVKSVDKTAALPGEFLIYTIIYTNNSPQNINNIVINDGVPDFTQNPVACCVGPNASCLGAPAQPFPAAITACSANVNGDALNWVLSGSLQSGQSGQVRFQVQIEN